MKPSFINNACVPCGVKATTFILKIKSVETALDRLL